MSRTPKITRAARRIRDDQALALTTGKTIAQALATRGLLPADATNDDTWPKHAVESAADIAHAHAGKITHDQALDAIDSSQQQTPDQ